jgi:hypothetical protein
MVKQRDAQGKLTGVEVRVIDGDDSCEINTEGKRWLSCSPMMAIGLTDHLWSIRDLLMLIPVPTNNL